MKNGLLWLTLAFIALVGGLHWMGSIYHFYWNSFWFDALMHALGGFVIGLLFLWIWYASGLFGIDVPSKRSALLTALVSAMIVGIGWEVFEFAYGIAAPIGRYPVDTFHDMLFDFAGGVLAGLIGRARKLYE